MADDKRFDIKITTQADTTGAVAASAAMKDVAATTDDITERARAMARETVDAARKASEASAQQTESLEKTADAAEATRNKVQAIAASMALTQQVEEAGRKMVSAAEEIRDVDTDLSKFLETAGSTVEYVGRIGGAMAQGYAAGGPWGALLAGGAESLGTILKYANDYLTIQQQIIDQEKQVNEERDKALISAEKRLELARAERDVSYAKRDADARLEGINQIQDPTARIAAARRESQFLSGRGAGLMTPEDLEVYEAKLAERSAQFTKASGTPGVPQSALDSLATEMALIQERLDANRSASAATGFRNADELQERLAELAEVAREANTALREMSAETSERLTRERAEFEAREAALREQQRAESEAAWRSFERNWKPGGATNANSQNSTTGGEGGSGSGDSGSQNEDESTVDGVNDLAKKRQTLQKIRDIIKDGKVTDKEAESLPGLVSELANNYSKATGTLQQMVSQLIAAVSQIDAGNEVLKTEINNIKSRLNSVSANTNS